MTFLFTHFTPLICRNRIYQPRRLSPLTDVGTVATAQTGRFHWVLWCTVNELGPVCSSLCSGLCVLVMEGWINHKMSLKAFIKHWYTVHRASVMSFDRMVLQWLQGLFPVTCSTLSDSARQPSAEEICICIKTGLATWRCVFIWWCACLD